MFSLSLAAMAATCGESAGDQHYLPVPHCPDLGTSEASATPACQAKHSSILLGVMRVRPQRHRLLLCSEPEAQASLSRRAAFLQCSQRLFQFAPDLSSRGLQTVPPAMTEAVPGKNHVCCAWDPGDHEVSRLLLCRQRHSELDRFAQS